MPDDNYNMIKPVESLQNIISLTPTKRREERKQRQNPQKEHSEQELDEQNGVDSQNSTSGQNENDEHSVDYCA
jgi:hypothetical protein